MLPHGFLGAGLLDAYVSVDPRRHAKILYALPAARSCLQSLRPLRHSIFGGYLSCIYFAHSNWLKNLHYFFNLAEMIVLPSRRLRHVLRG